MAKFKGKISDDLKDQIINSDDDRLKWTYLVEKMESIEEKIPSCIKDKIQNDIAWLKRLNWGVFSFIVGFILTRFFLNK